MHRLTSLNFKNDMTEFEAVRNLVALIIGLPQVLYSASMHICAPHLTGSKRLPYIAGVGPVGNCSNFFEHVGNLNMSKTCQLTPDGKSESVIHNIYIYT